MIDVSKNNEEKSLDELLDDVEKLKLLIEHNQDVVRKARETIQFLEDDISAKAVMINRRRSEAEREACIERGRAAREADPAAHEAFMRALNERCKQDVLRGSELGWWDVDEQGRMLAPPLVFKMSDFADVRNATLAHVMHRAELFPSVGQARKAGWDQPLVAGEWTVTKKRIRIRVQEG